MRFMKRGLTTNAIKVLACIFMVIDHIGVYLFPGVGIFRVIGRLAFPVFAFCVSLGCKYTKNKKKYLSFMAMMGIITQGIFLLCFKEWKVNVLFTFTISIILIYGYKYFIEAFKEKDKVAIISRGLLFSVLVGLDLLLTRYVHVDYNFYGTLLPLWVTVFDCDTYTSKYKEDRNAALLRLFGLFIGMTVQILKMGVFQLPCYLALLILLFYGNKKGKYNMKYLFYTFYPLHIIVLHFISLM